MKTVKSNRYNHLCPAFRLKTLYLSVKTAVRPIKRESVSKISWNEEEKKNNKPFEYPPPSPTDE